MNLLKPERIRKYVTVLRCRPLSSLCMRTGSSASYFWMNGGGKEKTELHLVVAICFSVNRADVALDRRHGDRERAHDFFVALPTKKQADHLALPGRKAELGRETPVRVVGGR